MMIFFVHLQSSCIQKSSLLQIHLGYEFSFHFDIVFVCDRKRWKETNEKYIELRSAKFYEAKNKVKFLRSGVRFVQLIDIFNTNRQESIDSAMMLHRKAHINTTNFTYGVWFSRCYRRKSRLVIIHDPHLVHREIKFLPQCPIPCGRVQWKQRMFGFFRSIRSHQMEIKNQICIWIMLAPAAVQNVDIRRRYDFVGFCFGFCFGLVCWHVCADNLHQKSGRLQQVSDFN